VSGSRSTNPDVKDANRILAVDWGERRIGLAVGNRRDGLAVRLAIVDRKPGHARRPDPVAEVARHADAEGAEALLIGLPLDGTGAEGPGVRRIRAFGEALATATGLPILWVDEHLTSVEAEEAARRAGWTPRSKKPLDDLAAAVLLQGYFDDERARAARARLDENSSPGDENRDTPDEESSPDR
jgi:putative Holliday junction resolvase